MAAQADKKKNRSLQKYKPKETFSFSQIIIALLLVVIIVAAVVIVLPFGWKNIKSEKLESKNEESLLSIANQAISESRTALSKIVDSVQALRALPFLSTPVLTEDNVVHINIPENYIATSTPALNEQRSVKSYVYINSDWQVGFDVPSDFEIKSFDDRLKFSSLSNELILRRSETFNLTDGWQPATSTAEKIGPHPFRLYSRPDTDEDRQDMRAVITTNNYFYIFIYNLVSEEDGNIYFNIIKTFKEL